MEVLVKSFRKLTLKIYSWYNKNPVISENSDLVDYECLCCFNEVPFDYLVQCDEGHLFCVQCFQRYIHEAVYGEGQQQLTCFAEGCGKSFSESQILRAIPDKLRIKFDERVRDEILSSANLDDLVKCPRCELEAILDPRDTFLVCPQCCQTTCRNCKQLYESHEDSKCKAAQDDEDTKRRKECEEKMAAVLIRKCPRCKLSFTKKDGCNKVVCRCGAKICYVCRKEINGYDHFCRHFRLPGRGCSVCNSCNLYTNTEEDDLRAIHEIQKTAERLKAGNTWAQTLWNKITGFFTTLGKEEHKKIIPEPK